MFFSTSLKPSRLRVNSSPTKARIKNQSNPSSQTWPCGPRQTQYNIEEKSLSSEGCSQVIEGSGEKKLKHGVDNTVECIPVITMDCSVTDTRSDNPVIETDTNNNTSPLLNSTSMNHGLNNKETANSSVLSTNGKPARSRNGHIKDSTNESTIKEGKHLQKPSKNSLHCGFSLGLERSKEVMLPEKRPNSCPKTVGKHRPDYLQTTPQENPSPKHSKARSQSLLERRKGGKESKFWFPNSGELKPKRKFSFPRPLSPRMVNASSSKPVASPGAVVTSSRASKRKTSITAAAAAFAAATAGAPCSPSSPLKSSHARFSFRKR